MIRKVEKSEIKEFVKIQVEAYPGFFNGSLEEIVGMVKVLEEYTENPVCFGYFENDKIVAGMILYIFEMNYNNEKKVLVGGLGSLAVALTHKKEKIAYKMIRFYQTYSEKKGCKLLALYPFNDRFYSKFGFAKGVIQYKYNFKPSQLITKTTNQKLRHSERSDLNKICDCVNRIAENKHGMYYIHSKDIKKYQKMKTQKCFVYEEDNLIKGFIIIDSKSNSKDNPLDNTLIVKEMYYEDSKVLNIILKFLKNQEDQYSYIDYYAKNANFHIHLNEIRTSNSTLMPKVSHLFAYAGLGLMYKIIDPYYFISKNLINEINIESFEIEDKLTKRKFIYNENRGNGVKFDQSIFSGWIMGLTSLEEYYDNGLVDIFSEDSIRQLDNNFYPRKGPDCRTEY